MNRKTSGFAPETKAGIATGITLGMIIVAVVTGFGMSGCSAYGGGRTFTFNPLTGDATLTVAPQPTPAPVMFKAVEK